MSKQFRSTDLQVKYLFWLAETFDTNTKMAASKQILRYECQVLMSVKPFSLSFYLWCMSKQLLTAVLTSNFKYLLHDFCHSLLLLSSIISRAMRF